MEQKTFEINGKSYPANLRDLKYKDENGLFSYHIKICYYLELDHGLMGFFPAKINGTKRMIITDNKELLQKIWEKLSTRKSKMSEDFFYVHENGLVGYPAKHWTGDDSEAIACHLMTQNEYDILTNPFVWTPGVIGNDMSPEEFLETIKNAAEKE